MKRKAIFLLLICAIFTVMPFVAYAYTTEVYEIPHNEEVPEAAYGIWQVPCLGTSSPLYEAPKGKGQDVVDAENSAFIEKYGKGMAIYDHAWSEVKGGIWCVENMQVGCGAFLLREGKPEICYQCTSIYLTMQVGNYYKYNGQNILPKDKEILCMSCAEEDGFVYVAVFEYVGEMP